MSRGKDLIKNTGILMIGTMSTKMITFFLLPVYTALLSVEEYGQLDVYTSLVMLIIPFATLQVEQGLFRFLIPAKTSEDRETILSSGVAATLTSGSVFTLLYWIVVAFTRFSMAGLLYIYYLVQAATTIMLQIARGFGKNTVYAIGTFLCSTLAVLLNVLFVVAFHLGIQGVLLATILAHIVTAVYLMAATRFLSYLKPGKVRAAATKDLLQFSIPLIFNQISSWAINYSDRLIILAVLGVASNGIFSVASKFSAILNTIFGVYIIAWTENVVRAMDDKDYSGYVDRIATLSFNVYTCAVAGVLNLLPFAFRFLVNESFHDAYPHIPILLIAMLFSGMSALIGSMYIARKKTVNVGVTTFLAGVVNVAVHLGLIRKTGLYAASISTLVSFVALFVYRLIGARSFQPVRFAWGSCGAGLAVLAFSWFGYLSRNTPLILMGLVLTLAYLAWIVYRNWNEMKLVLKNKGL